MDSLFPLLILPILPVLPFLLFLPIYAEELSRRPSSSPTASPLKREKNPWLAPCRHRSEPHPDLACLDRLEQFHAKLTTQINRETSTAGLSSQETPRPLLLSSGITQAEKESSGRNSLRPRDNTAHTVYLCRYLYHIPGYLYIGAAALLSWSQLASGEKGGRVRNAVQGSHCIRSAVVHSTLCTPTFQTIPSHKRSQTIIRHSQIFPRVHPPKTRYLPSGLVTIQGSLVGVLVTCPLSP